MEGRKSTKVGRVLELVSEGKVNQFAFTVDGTWRYYKDGELSFSYTLGTIQKTILPIMVMWLIPLLFPKWWLTIPVI